MEFLLHFDFSDASDVGRPHAGNPQSLLSYIALRAITVLENFHRGQCALRLFNPYRHKLMYTYIPRKVLKEDVTGKDKDTCRITINCVACKLITGKFNGRFRRKRII